MGVRKCKDVNWVVKGLSRLLERLEGLEASGCSRGYSNSI